MLPAAATTNLPTAEQPGQKSPTKKNPSDVIILYESSAMIGVCFDILLKKFIKPALEWVIQFFFLLLHF